MEGLNVRALKAHLAINVRNLEKSATFYRNILELSPARLEKAMQNLMFKTRRSTLL